MSASVPFAQTRSPLPIDVVLPSVLATLRQHRNLVLTAEPGAGKTTRVPLAILESDLLAPEQQILVLEPRRIAARFAARRVAETCQSKMGERVGYNVRFENNTSPRTRLCFLTEGILLRQLQDDPSLAHVGVVVLDEFHERSLDTDLSIALLAEMQRALRPDLRIVVMSATLDPKPIQNFLDDCVALHSEGRLYPLDVRYLERTDERPLVSQMLSLCKEALTLSKNNILVFLPGASDIFKLQNELTSWRETRTPRPTFEICPLYGELDAQAQDRALSATGVQKVILSTNIAESSLTVEGVDVVIDCGLAKVLRYDPSSGLEHLSLERIGRDNATQRAGRAGRLGPGIVLRAWTEKEFAYFPQRLEAEILRSELSAATMQILAWSGQDPKQFAWFEKPPAVHLERALDLLHMLDAVAHDRFALTVLGQKMAQLPLEPRLAHLLLSARDKNLHAEAALLVAIASERDALEQNVSATNAHAVWASDWLYRFEQLQKNVYVKKHVQKEIYRLRDQLLRNHLPNHDVRPKQADEDTLLELIFHSFPDRVMRRLANNDDRVAFAGGGRGRLHPQSGVKTAEYMVCIRGQRRPSNQAAHKVVDVLWASQISPEWLLPFSHVVEEYRFDKHRACVGAQKRRLFGQFELETVPLLAADTTQVAKVLAEAAEKQLEEALPLTDVWYDFVGRYQLMMQNCPELNWPQLDLDFRRQHLAALCEGKSSFAELQNTDLVRWMLSMLPGEVRTLLNKHTPDQLELPSGRTARIHYGADGVPVLKTRIQDVFGWTTTPRIVMGRVALKLELLAPNQRPLQITRDLASFWSEGYPEVRKQMRGRYPKHPWPEDPRQRPPPPKPKR